MSEHEDVQPVVVRDKRRVDPSGAVRKPAPETAAPVEAGVPDGAADYAAGIAADPDGAEDLRRLEAALAERTADLQRVKAEYDNYRRRVERDRALVAEQALAAVLANLLPVLDDVDRAREHGELTGGFKSVADALETVLGKLGLERFGLVGEPFDPLRHEAVTHEHSDDVTEPTCIRVMRAGYQIGERLLRPAMVGVADPPEPTATE